MNKSIVCLAAAFAATVAAAEPGATPAKKPGDENLVSPLSALPQSEQRECEAYGETYLRIAEYRDTGADKSVAIDRGVEFLSKLGRTGSHHRGKNYKPAVTQFADFVYANPKLFRGTMYLYGLSSCAISKKAPDDPAFEIAMTALEKSLGRCQGQFPDHARVKQMGACVLDPVNGQLQQWAQTATK